jgi:hypothetical protein
MCLPRLGPESGIEPPVCQPPHRLAIVTVAFAQHRDGQQSRSTDLHNDLAHISLAPPVAGPTIAYIGSRCTCPEKGLDDARRSVVTRSAAGAAYCRSDGVAMKWHFSFGDFGDLTRLPNLVDELREVPIREVVPKGYGPHAPTAGVFESGGSTRARKRFIVMPERDEQVTRWHAAKLLETPGSGTSRVGSAVS